MTSRKASANSSGDLVRHGSAADLDQRRDVLAESSLGDAAMS